MPGAGVWWWVIMGRRQSQPPENRQSGSLKKGGVDRCLKELAQISGDPRLEQPEAGSVVLVTVVGKKPAAAPIGLSCRPGLGQPGQRLVLVVPARNQR